MCGRTNLFLPRAQVEDKAGMACSWHNCLTLFLILHKIHQLRSSTHLADPESDSPEAAAAPVASLTNSAAPSLAAAAESPVAEARAAPTAEQKQRRQRLKARRAAIAAAPFKNPSRDLADTAHAEVYKRPAFHNYGRGSATSGVSPPPRHT